MKKTTYRRWLLVALLVTVLALLAAQCGGAAPTQVPAEEAPAQKEAEKPAEEEAQSAETEAEEPAEAAATEEPAAADEQTVAKSVEESQISKEVNKGVTVVTDEPDVSALRTQQGGTYRNVATSDAVSFHPYLTSDSASGGYQGLVWTGGLLRLDENTLDYIPNMAESYTISEDGLTFTFKLRQDLKWSDGQPITAHDFQFAYDQATKPENEYPYLSQLEFITSYKAVDDYTLEIKIGEVYAPALGQMSGLITPLPKHVWEKLDWSDPEKNPEILNPTVVSGVYKLKEWNRDQYALFEANENYWYHGAPNITEYSIEIVPDSDIAYEKMKKGETDTGTILPENLEEAKQLPNVTVYEWWSVSAQVHFIGLNLREGFATHDINVRHALSYAIDKDLLTEEVMLGQAKRSCSIYPETSWAYNPDVPCYDYDPDKAIAEFEEAGYTFEDGKMLDKDGQQLKLKLLYGPNTNKIRELMAVIVQDDLRKIGVEVEVQAMEWASFLEAFRSEDPDWDMVILSTNSTPEPHTSFPWWTKENIPQLNFEAYINPEVEKLFDEAAATYDLDVRKEKYGEIQRILAEDAPRVFLFYSKSWSGQNNRIKGIEPTRLGIGWNSEDWYIEETEQ
jgi:peptide/nickel transport system substrate-binding protein